MQGSDSKLLRPGNTTHHSGSWVKQTGHEVRGRGAVGPRKSDLTLAHPSVFSLPVWVQLAAQVLEDLNDEDIGFGLVDEKKDSAVAKKLGKRGWWRLSGGALGTCRLLLSSL